jgi:MoaA/NifB/PqqE/SkfB family radical SAM enzyme
MGKPIGNIFKDSFSDIWNSKVAVEIRESIFDQTFRFCNKNICPVIVSGGIEKQSIQEENKGIIIEKKLHMDKGPKDLSLNYDYSCNLYCKSCRDKRKVMDRETAEKLIEFQDTFLNSELFKSVRRLTISGTGEPLASRVYMDLFNKIDRHKNPGLKITLRTNGILLTPETWGRIKNVHFAIDQILISIDAASEKVYQLLRRGGDFRKLLENLKFLQELKKKYKFVFRLNFVAQKQNFREMPKFVKLAKKFECDKVVFTQLMNLGTFCHEEYLELAVHKPGNPEFGRFKKIMNKSIFKDPIVDFNNLSNLLYL